MKNDLIRSHVKDLDIAYRESLNSKETIRLLERKNDEILSLLSDAHTKFSRLYNVNVDLERALEDEKRRKRNWQRATFYSIGAGVLTYLILSK